MSVIQLRDANNNTIYLDATGAGTAADPFQIRYGVPGGFTAVGSFIRHTNLSSAQTLTKPAGASGLLIQAKTQNVVISFDGTEATATNGLEIPAGDTWFVTIEGDDVSIIEATASAEARAQWFG